MSAAAAAPAEIQNMDKRFDGRVFHAHCDPQITAESLTFDFPGKGEMQFGVITPDIFIVINSPDLMAAVQKQLANHMTGAYKAQSVTIQLGDAEGALGSEMISENLAARATALGMVPSTTPRFLDLTETVETKVKP